MFEKSLSDLVRGIRAHKGSEVSLETVRAWAHFYKGVASIYSYLYLSI